MKKNKAVFLLPKRKKLIIDNLVDDKIIAPKTIKEYHEMIKNNPIGISFFAPEIIQTEIGKLKLVCITEENGKHVPYYKRVFSD